MTDIDVQSNNRLEEDGQPSDDGLGQPNPSATDEIVRRGKEALERKRRDFDDWMFIAEAHQVGRAEVMRAVQTNKPTGKRYEKAMAHWLFAHSFHVIDKCTRNHLFECLEHRTEIENWRAILTESERFRFNHPTSVLRKWKAATVVPDQNAPPKASAMAKLKESVVRLEEDNHRMRKEIERGGGDLWSKDDRVGDIADIMLTKLTTDKAKRVAEAILAKVKAKKAAQPKPARQNVEAAAPPSSEFVSVNVEVEAVAPEPVAADPVPASPAVPPASPTPTPSLAPSSPSQQLARARKRAKTLTKFLVVEEIR
jgi:hypothetical protein